MFERKVSEADIRTILESGRTIEDYPEDVPFPSRLILGRVRERPLHVVAARNEEQKELIIITVYEPDLDLWEQDFKTRRRK